MAIDPGQLAAGLRQIFRFDPDQATLNFYAGFPTLEQAFNVAVDSPTADAARATLSLYHVFLGRQPEKAADGSFPGLDFWAQSIAFGGIRTDDLADFFASSPEFQARIGGRSNLEIVNDFYTSFLGRAGETEGLVFWTGLVDSGQLTVAQLGRFFAASQEFQTRADGNLDGFLLTAAAGDPNGRLGLPGADLFDAPTFANIGAALTVTPDTAAGADVMRLTGSQDVRIDFTNPANQITGLDLDFDGTIERDGVENAITGRAAGYEIVDAIARNPLNGNDSFNNYTGDIFFDGTGFDGDGTSTDGNIFLGGLGTNTALTGIGNDFLAAAGAANDFVGGRNADFFFVSFATLSDGSTPGDFFEIDGGGTYDSSSSEDSDWLLLEASDDDEPVTIRLDTLTTDREVATRFGRSGDLHNVENLNASGNLYGFLDDMDVVIGELQGDRADDLVGTPNTGIGATAQLDVIGSDTANIVIGGFDNDTINGNGGADILFGGDIRFRNANPNIRDVVDPVTGAFIGGIDFDGRDKIFGGDANDNIAFETDGGVYEGANEVNVNDSRSAELGLETETQHDTLWLVDTTFGRLDADTVTQDGVVRIDLEVGKEGGLNNAAGYGGADANASSGNYTSDQTLYADGFERAQVQDFESVIATGLGGVDYEAAGSNDPELLFSNQQNYFALDADLDLRGTDHANVFDGSTRIVDNVLYAAAGNDIVEGRGGNDNLSGGDGNDDFIISLNAGDDLDAIWRQTDANADNLWDGGFERDFGVGSTTIVGESALIIRITAPAFPGAELGEIINRVSEIRTGVFVDGAFVPVVLNTDAIRAAGTYAELTDAINAALDETAFAADLSATLSGDGVTILIDDAQGRELADSADEADAGIDISQLANTTTQNVFSFDEPEVVQFSDRLIYASYEDRRDGELTDDDGFIDSLTDAVTLGGNAYAEDLVVSFNRANGTYDDAVGTTLTEAQSYTIDFTNLANEDTVSVSINGVVYTAQVGRNPNGTANDADYNETTKDFSAFLTRFANLINAQDAHGAAGQVVAAAAGSALTLTQAAPAHGEDVYMEAPIVTLGNASGGEPASFDISEGSNTSTFLLGFDGRDNALNEENVLFIGNTGISRSVLETADNAGGSLTGSDAILIDSVNDQDTRADDFHLHGDDLLVSGAGNDSVTGLTGDDRVFASVGTDTADGGKDLYFRETTGATADVITRNSFENTTGYTRVSADVVGGSTAGFYDTLVVQQRDYAANGAVDPAVTFTIALDAGLISSPTDAAVLSDGAKGTVTQFLNGVATTNVTTFTNFEGVRTISGDNTLARQGNDTLTLAAVSDAALATAATGTVAFEGAGVDYDLADGAVSVRHDRNGNDATVETLVMLDVFGVENVIGGAGDDSVTVGFVELGKNNQFSLAGETLSENREGDVVVYDFTNFETKTNVPASDIVTTLTVEAATETDWVDFTGPSIAGAPRDTLVDVESILFGTDTLESSSDVLDVSNITGGALVNFGGTVNLGQSVSGVDETGDDEGVVDEDLIEQGGIASQSDISAELLVLDSTIEKFEVVDGTGSGDRMILEDRAGGVDDNAGRTFNLGAGGDVLDYRNEDDDIIVSLSTDGSETTEITVLENLSDEDNDVYANDTASSAENYVAGTANNVIDLRDATVATTTIFSADVEVSDPNGEDDTAADFDPPGRIVEVTDTTGGTVRGRFWETLTAAAGLWNVVLGGAQAETVVLTDNEDDESKVFILGSGANVANYSGITATDGAQLTFGVGQLDLGGDPETATHVMVSAAGGTDQIQTEANSLTVRASTARGDDIVNIGALVGGDDGDPDTDGADSNVVNLNTGIVQELIDGVVVNTIAIANFDDIVASAIADSLTGNGSDNIINGLGGGDTISGLGGADTIDGGAGDDVIDGGAGEDTIVDGTGADTITTGSGDDLIAFTNDATVDTVIYVEGDEGDTETFGGSFATGVDQVFVNTADADLDDVTIALTSTDLGGGEVNNGATIDFDADAGEVVTIDATGVGAGTGTIALTDFTIRVQQSTGSDAQTANGAGGPVINIVYTDANQSGIAQIDEIFGLSFGEDAVDLSAFDFVEDQDFDDSGVLELDEFLVVQTPTSVFSGSAAADFFSVTRDLGAGAVTFDSLVVVQYEPGSDSSFRFFVDVNGDGDFNETTDLAFDIRDEVTAAAPGDKSIDQIIGFLNGAAADGDLSGTSDFFIF